MASSLSSVSGKILPETSAFFKANVIAFSFYFAKCTYIFISVHEVHIKWYFNVCFPKPPGFFGINGNFINYYKIKSLFLFSYGSMKVTGLFKGYFLTFVCR